jgi:hypothetical protein
MERGAVEVAGVLKSLPVLPVGFSVSRPLLRFSFMFRFFIAVVGEKGVLQNGEVNSQERML